MLTFSIAYNIRSINARIARDEDISFVFRHWAEEKMLFRDVDGALVEFAGLGGEAG
jgi:hypothetical protein